MKASRREQPRGSSGRGARCGGPCGGRRRLRKAGRPQGSPLQRAMLEGLLIGGDAVGRNRFIAPSRRQASISVKSASLGSARWGLGAKAQLRSEERRVGEEGRSRWAPYH